MERPVAQLTIKLIRLAVFDRTGDLCASDFDEQTAVSVYEFAKFHEIVPIISYAFDKLGIKGDDGIFRTIKEETYFTVMRVEGLEYLHKRTEEVLSESGIDHIMLKGSLIRRLYPAAYLRPSSDVDVLVKEVDYQKAIKVLSDSLGMRMKGSTTHDVSLFDNAGGHLEIHRTLVDGPELAEAEKVLADIWSHTASDGHKYYMSKEAFVFYHVVHMAKHIVGGGCGVRFFIDLKLILDDGYDRAALEKLLESAKMTRFFDCAVRLVGLWFGGEKTDETNEPDQEDETIRELARYVLSGGIYGKTDNMVAIRGAKKQGKLKYAVQRIFLPYDKLKYIYPSLDGKPVLTPIYQVRRWARAIFRGKIQNRMTECKAIDGVTEEYAKTLCDLMQKIGLD